MPSRIRSNNKHIRIAAMIRREIQRGSLPPGSQLPSYEEMLDRYGVARVTLAQAIAELKHEGVLRSEGRGGLFVTEKSIELNHYALVLSYTPPRETPSRFYEALTQAAHVLSQRHDQQIDIYRDVLQRDDNEVYHKLVGDVQRNRLAGLFFVGNPYNAFDVKHSPLFTHPISRIVSSPRPVAGVAQIDIDWSAYIDALRDCQTRYRVTRVAVLALSQTDLLTSVTRALKAMNIPMVADMPVCLERTAMSSAAAVVKLLFDQPRDKQPQAIAFLDDNLLPFGVQGMSDAVRARVGRDLCLISPCNWPVSPKVDVPVKLVGLDCCAFLQHAIDALRQQARQPGKQREQHYRYEIITDEQYQHAQACPDK